MKVLVILVAMFAFGCSSSPDIPDQTEEANYRSTNLEGEEKEAQPEEMPGDPAPKEVVSVVKATGPVATVNGNPIPAEEFNTEINRVMQTGQVPVMMVNQAKGTIIQKLVDRYLLDQAIEKENIVVSDEEVDKKLDEVKSEFQKVAAQRGQNVTLDMLVQQMGITQEELRKSLKQSVAIEKVLVKRGMGGDLEGDAKKFYDENSTQFQRPEAVHVRHILITVAPDADEAAWEKAKANAETVRKEASAKGADFGEIAKKKSQGPSASKGGDLGFVPRKATVPEFENASFALKDGEISKPVRSPYGWHIIKREGYKAAGQVPFEEVKEPIIAKLKADQIQSQLDGFLKELRAAAAIEIHNENVK